MDKYIIPVSYLQPGPIASEAKIQSALQFLLFFVIAGIIICTWIAKTILPDSNDIEDKSNLDHDIIVDKDKK